MSSSSSSPPVNAVKRKVIIDTDAGCDDAIAILMALRDPTIDVVAITTTFGNVSQVQATENVYTILRVFNRLDIPFYSGASQPLVVDLQLTPWPGHGKNGLGDASFLEGGEQHDHESYLKKVKHHVGQGHAVQALIDLSKKYPGEIDIIALGPLTNLALGVRMDPGFASRFHGLTIMGGVCLGKGNATMAGEFNFYCDPEGAYVTLQHFPGSTRTPVMVVPWEVTEAASLRWEEFDALTAGWEDHIEGDANTKHKLEASFLKKTHAKYELVARHDLNIQPPTKRAKSSAGAENGSILTSDQVAALNELPSRTELAAAATNSTIVGSGSSSVAVGAQSYFEEEPSNYVCCDSYAVAAFLNPSIITTHARHYAEVQIQGTADIRGMLAIDWYDRKKGQATTKKIEIVTGIDKAAYIKMMTNIFQPNSSSNTHPDESMELAGKKRSRSNQKNGS